MTTTATEIKICLDSQPAIIEPYLEAFDEFYRAVQMWMLWDMGLLKEISFAE